MGSLPVLILLAGQKHYFELYFRLLSELRKQADIEVTFMVENYQRNEVVDTVCSSKKYNIIVYSNEFMNDIPTKSRHHANLEPFVSNFQKGICITEAVRNEFERQVLETCKTLGITRYCLADGWQVMFAAPKVKFPGRKTLVMAQAKKILRKLIWLVKGSESPSVGFYFDYIFSGGSKTTELLKRKHPHLAILETGLSCFDGYTVSELVPLTDDILVVVGVCYEVGYVSKDFADAYIDGVSLLVEALPDHHITIRFHPRSTCTNRYLVLSREYSNCHIEYADKSFTESLIIAESNSVRAKYKWLIGCGSTTFMEAGLLSVHTFFFDPHGIFESSVYVQEGVVDYQTEISQIIRRVRLGEYSPRYHKVSKCFEEYCGQLDGSNTKRICNAILNIQSTKHV